MISPYLYDDREFEELLLDWNRKGTRVIAVVFDSMTFRSLWENLNPARGSEWFVRKLDRRGVKCHLIPCAVDLRALFTAESP